MAVTTDVLPPPADPTDPRLRVVVASSRRIDLANEKDTKAIRRQAAWQTEAWRYNRTTPEIKFGSRFVSSSMSRLRLYPGLIVAPDEPPVPLHELVQVDNEGNPEGRVIDDPLPPGLAEDAAIELERLSNRRTGQAGLLRGFGLCLTVSGDSWLIGTDDDQGAEDWHVYSEAALVKNPSPEDGQSEWAVRGSPDGKPRPLSADATTIRVWREDGEWPDLADSNLQACLDVAEELGIWGRVLRASARSSVNNGFLLVPTELDLPNEPNLGAATDPAATDSTEADDRTKLERDLEDAQLDPLEDEGDPATVAATLVRGKAEHLKEFRHVLVNRPVDRFALERIASLIRRLASGLDLPIEVITGIADISHWGQWFLDEMTYKAHIEPTAQIAVQAITVEWLRPALLADGYDARHVNRVVIGIDPSQLVLRPNQSQDAKDAWDRAVLGDTGLRRRLSIADREAPTDDEIIRRFLMEHGSLSANQTAALLRTAYAIDVPDDDTPQFGQGGGAPEPGAEDRPEPEQEPGHQDGVDDEPVAAAGALAAAAAGNRLGERLAAIDGRLRDRLQVAAGAALAEALRRAGNRLRGAVQGNPDLAARVNGVESDQVGIALGEVAALTVADVDDLLADAWTDLEGQWQAWVPAAQADVAQLVMAEAIDEDDGEAAAAEYESASAEGRDLGWGAMAAGLASLARERLFNTPTATLVGETDPTATVSAGLIRDALSVAGGGTTSSPGGVATGPWAVRAVSRIDLLVQAWEWRLGSPARPFDPHVDLAGTTFTDFEDARLANDDGWPPFATFFPGDHDGCQCDAVPIIVRLAAEDVDELEPEGEPVPAGVG